MRRGADRLRRRALLLGLALMGSLAGCLAGSNQNAGSATLTWTGSTHAAVTGYRVYYGVAPGAYLQPKGAGIGVGRVETFVVTGLVTGQRYYFAVTAVDSSGNESAYSQEASKVVQ
jgi:hypothetical protein